MFTGKYHQQCNCRLFPVVPTSSPVSPWEILLNLFIAENYSRQDTEKCLEMLKDRLLPAVNLFGYGQVESYGTSGDFYEALHKRFPEDECVALSRIPDRNAIVDSIKTFLGRGK